MCFWRKKRGRGTFSSKNKKGWGRGKFLPSSWTLLMKHVFPQHIYSLYMCSLLYLSSILVVLVYFRNVCCIRFLSTRKIFISVFSLALDHKTFLSTAKNLLLYNSTGRHHGTALCTCCLFVFVTVGCSRRVINRLVSCRLVLFALDHPASLLEKEPPTGHLARPPGVRVINRIVSCRVL